MSETLQKLQKSLGRARTAAIVIHRNPDGDAIGSGLAMQRFLQKRGIKTYLISPNLVPKYLRWLPGADKILVYDYNPEEVKKSLRNADIIFTLDFNDFSRTGEEMQKLLEEQKKAGKEFVMIDHHYEPADYADYQFSDHHKSSTAEMVYEFIEALGGKDEIDKEMATALYTGIMTDTGSFKFPNTTAQTMRIAADLMEKGAEHNKIQIKIYDSFSIDKLHLLGEALNRLVFLPEYKTAYIALDQETLQKHNFQKGDTEGFVNYGLALNDANFAVMFLENEDGSVRISFRSKGKFPANEFAKKHFEGGGHLNAAGGKNAEGMEEAVKLFLKKLPGYKEELLHANEDN